MRTLWAIAPVIFRIIGMSSKNIPSMQGGFIWDWVDQGILTKKSHQGNPLGLGVRRFEFAEQYAIFV
jgi:hypothetical protein